MTKKNLAPEGKRIFVTGGSGFIGTNLCERLIRDNEIIVYDTGRRNAIKYTDLLKRPGLTFIEGDISDREKLSKAADGCDMIVHLAAIAGIDSVTIDPLSTMKINLMGTYELLEAVKGRRLERFVLFSTSEVYGPYVFRADETAMTSQGEVGVLRWTYATSKLAAEHLAHCYYSQFGLPLTIIRPFNVYGPRQVGEGAVHKFVVNAIDNEDLVIYGDGNQIRAWCYVDDIIDAVTLALAKDKAVGNVFNLGNPNSTVTIQGLAQKIIRLSGSKSRIVFKSRDYPDIEIRVPDVSKAERLLGFKPRVDLDEGIQRTIDWYRNISGDRK